MKINAPYINISKKRLVETVLYISFQEFEEWPLSVQEPALDLAKEFFMLRSNPFVQPELIKESVFSRLDRWKDRFESQGYYQLVKDKLEEFWSEQVNLLAFQQEVKQGLNQILDEEYVVDSPHALVQFATDATGLVMELPLLVVFPDSTEEIQSIIRLANEKGFSIIPRGGGTGLTGGAVPARRNSVILSMSRMKKIFAVDEQEKLLSTQTGVITIKAIQAAEEKNLLLTVDPASKMASSLGGNIAENAGGPYAFEYGTTLDNVLSYKMVTPQGELIEIQRKNHTRHKIFPEETVTFEVRDEQGNIKDTIELKGDQIRTPGLGKDVTNKHLGGLPGVQKEGVDGIITEACFVLHPRLEYSQTLCLEFYGSSMHNASLVIGDLVRLRDRIRERSKLVTMSALEEFNAKYIKAIDYEKKSTKYEGDPISVLLIRLDSDEEHLLEEVVWTIGDIVGRYEDVDVIVAGDEAEQELFWEDRHKLSAISRRTSGFKINEDVVIPLERIPDFSDFIESLNVYYLTLAYQDALRKVLELSGVNKSDEFIEMELGVCDNIMQGSILSTVMAEQEFGLQIHYFFQDLFSRYPDLKPELTSIERHLFDFRIEIANHMHAGDGNCHVNIPVHSDNLNMLAQAEVAVDRVFKKVQALGGELSGEHGIGITKIRYLSDLKIQALRKYKQEVDPGNVINPDKLMQKELVVEPYTVCWERLVLDMDKIDLPQKETLKNILNHIRICTRCGKCKDSCPMYFPEKGYLHHPRNKNLSLGFLLEALAYTQSVTGSPDSELYCHIQKLMEYCTACGKCFTKCPVKINSAEVALDVRSFLEKEGVGGHPLKSKVLNYFGEEPERIPFAAKTAAVGQRVQDSLFRFIPSFWRRRVQNPWLQVPEAKFEISNLGDLIDLKKNNLFISESREGQENIPGVLYFPGCGSGLFYSSIALAGMYLLLQTGNAVIVPDEHKCCGYPLLFAGCSQAFDKNKFSNLKYFEHLIQRASNKGVNLEAVVTSCGTCRASLEQYDLDNSLSQPLELYDIIQYIYPRIQEITPKQLNDKLIYHSSCHSAWTNIPQNEAGEKYSNDLEAILGTEVEASPNCCAESGLGALTSPEVYNRLRQRKKNTLEEELEDYPEDQPILVSCPSCKIGISRVLHTMGKKNQVMHTLEYLAYLIGGSDWKNDFVNKLITDQENNLEETEDLTVSLQNGN